MIKVTIGNNVKRESVIIDENTTLRSALEANGVDYARLYSECRRFEPCYQLQAAGVSRLTETPFCHLFVHGAKHL